MVAPPPGDHTCDQTGKPTTVGSVTIHHLSPPSPKLPLISSGSGPSCTSPPRQSHGLPVPAPTILSIVSTYPLWHRKLAVSARKEKTEKGGQQGSTECGVSPALFPQSGGPHPAGPSFAFCALEPPCQS